MKNSIKQEFWNSRRNKITTRIGGWRIGEAIYCHGYSLLDDLVGKITYFQLLILNVTGFLPDKRLADWLEAAYSCLSFPDPRIWCNHIGALAGSNRTTPVAGVLAGVLASDSHMYGPGTASDVYKFLKTALTLKANGNTIENIIDRHRRRSGTKAIMPGFARPIATGDERVIAMNRITHDLNFNRGEYLTLAVDIESSLLTTDGEGMNLATYIVAFLMDQAWTLENIEETTTLIVSSGVAACYSEARKNPPGAFLPLRCDDIEYKGPPPRPVPDRNSD